MRFYMLEGKLHDTHATNEVYVNRDDFDKAVNDALDEGLHEAGDDVTRDEIERQVSARTHTFRTLAKIDDTVECSVGEAEWREMGRSHDGKRPCWSEGEYHAGNADLYRQTADSLRNAEDETMSYEQSRFHDPGLPEALSLDDIDPEARFVSEEMASAIDPCETAACVAGHAYVCAHGWRSFLQTCVRTRTAVPSPSIEDGAAAELGMSEKQCSALFPAEPQLRDIIEAFEIASADWTCPTAEADEIETRWEERDYRAADMAIVLDTLARRCDRVNAFVAAIDN
ncbi:MAG: hypothetical protein OXG72_00275 [Acidobacteria bacterium]|nr:hypothetical protein [Acidobacteriota bacterium]